jgi:nucleoside-diphosphate-sugar epimerase
VRIVVIGAGGFVGRHLTRTLLDQRHHVHAIVRRSSSAMTHPVTVMSEIGQGALADVLREVRADAIVNLAAAGVAPGDRDVAQLVATNVDLPAIVVVAASTAGVRAVVHVGSSAEYAARRDATCLREDASLETRRLYGASKAAGTLLARAAGEHLEVPVAIARLFNVFGPGEASHRLFPTLVRNLEARTRVPLSEGSQMRDFMHVQEACEAIGLLIGRLAESPSIAGCYNVSSGRPVSVADFARTVARAMEADPGLLDFGAIPMRPDDLAAVVGAPDSIRRAIGWSCTLPLAQAVDAAVAQMRTPEIATGTASC